MSCFLIFICYERQRERQRDMDNVVYIYIRKYLWIKVVNDRSILYYNLNEKLNYFVMYV